MINAKEELIDEMEGRVIEAAKIYLVGYRMKELGLISEIEDYDQGVVASLKQDWTSNDLKKFLEDLDFEYYDSYGGQELFGTVWFTDGTWLTRGEYDGSEWWELHERPEIPEELL